MHCKPYIALLSGHLDGCNTEAEEASLQAHLAACPACRARLEDYRRQDEALHTLFQEEVPEGFTARVMQALPPRAAAPKKRKAWYLRPSAAMGAAAAALLLLVGLYILPQNAAQQGEIPPEDLPQAYAAQETVAAQESEEAQQHYASFGVRNNPVPQAANEEADEFAGNPYASKDDWIEQTQKQDDSVERRPSLYEMPLYATWDSSTGSMLLSELRASYPVLCIYGLEAKYVHQLAEINGISMADGRVHYWTTYAVLEELMQEYAQFASLSYGRGGSPKADDRAIIVWFPLDYVIPAGYTY